MLPCNPVPVLPVSAVLSKEHYEFEVSAKAVARGLQDASPETLNRFRQELGPEWSALNSRIQAFLGGAK